MKNAVLDVLVLASFAVASLLTDVPYALGFWR